MGTLVHGWWRRASWLDRLRLRRAEAIGPVLAVECDEPLPCGTLVALTTSRAPEELWARVVELTPRGDGLYAMQLALLSEPPAPRDARGGATHEGGATTPALDPREGPRAPRDRADSHARVAAPSALDWTTLSCAALSPSAARTPG